MKTSKFSIIIFAALCLLPAGCTMERNLESPGEMKNTSVHFLSGSSERSGKKKSKTPRFSEAKARKAILFQQKLNGVSSYETTQLRIGTFEATSIELDKYAALAANGLVNVSNKAVLNTDSGKYTSWITVELTDEGRRYLHKSSIKDNTRPLVKSLFDSLYFNPARDFDEYGRKYLDPCVDSAVTTLLGDFYASYIDDEVRAISRFCDSEFVEAFNRLTEVDSYMKKLGRRTLPIEHVFTAGKEHDSAAFVCNQITKYKNTYTVSFDDGSSVMLIMSEGNKSIFDLVFSEDKNSTVRTENASVSDASLKELAKMCAEKKETAPAPVVSKEREWYAPGLELAEVEGPTEYETAMTTSYSTYVTVDLYHYEIEKIYQVSVKPRYSDTDEASQKYDAVATVVFKRSDMTPFQFILQKYGAVNSVDDSNLYASEDYEFTYFDDCGWTLE